MMYNNQEKKFFDEADNKAENKKKSKEKRLKAEIGLISR